ncbi:MAG TPA: haloacid dehalogenase-like hydrolase [Pyrinomonadaceae bacterium]|jgi:phosphoserine phosphatase
MENYYALIDWDGTVRSGFTIVSWAKFLVKNKIISGQIIKDLENLFDLYSKKQLTHDQLAEHSANVYANYIQGVTVDILKGQAVLFTESDRFHLINLSFKLLDYLKDRGVTLIAISGTPLEILSQYKHLLALSYVYALELEHFDGIYTGNIISNPGISETKKRLAESLIKKDWQVIVAMGNSESDIPLFEAAQIRVIVNNSDLSIEGNNFKLNDEIQLKTILDVLEAKITK